MSRTRRRVAGVAAGVLILAALILAAFLLATAQLRTTAMGSARTGRELGQKSRADRHPEGAGWVPIDHQRAVQAALTPRKPVEDAEVQEPALRQQRLRSLGLSVADIENHYVVLTTAPADPFDDLYGPVRFMHATHANSLAGNCALCHHARPTDRLGSETVACRACHPRAPDPEQPQRVRLKAAYHLRCIGCHQEMNRGPTHCGGCHRKHVPNHEDLVELPPDPSPRQVTAECLRCHPGAGADMLESAHWLWRGPSPYTVGRCREILCGKATNAINNFCLGVASNWPRCTSCHAGYGWNDADFDFSDPTRIDCLVCHDTTGSYFKTPTGAGMPAPEVDLVYVATRVGATSRSTCGECHFSGGGGDAVKHAEMGSMLRYPERTCDVHMGGYDFSCTECHATQNHRIYGRSSSVPVAEGSFLCEDCHTSHPHYGDTLLDHHLNEHCRTLACNTCHSPIYAKCRPTRVWWDWSVAGDKRRPVPQDEQGMPTYNWMKGEFRWEESAKPEYAWHNGYMQRVLAGDVVELNGAVVSADWATTRKARGRYIHIVEPLGDMADPASRITPFKIMRGVQPADSRHRTLLIPHLFPSGPGDTTAYWRALDWRRALAVGMGAASLPFSGEYEWVRTDMYWRIEHEVMPKEMALSCAHCHPALAGARTCDRCHHDGRNIDFAGLAHKGIDFAALAREGHDVEDLIGVTDYIGFTSLGYRGDPIIHGGRFKRLRLASTAAQIEPDGGAAIVRQHPAGGRADPPRATSSRGGQDE